MPFHKDPIGLMHASKWVHGHRCSQRAALNSVNNTPKPLDISHPHFPPNVQFFCTERRENNYSIITVHSSWFIMNLQWAVPVVSYQNYDDQAGSPSRIDQAGSPSK